jgi:hypothetical protein
MQSNDMEHKTLINSNSIQMFPDIQLYDAKAKEI